MTADHTHSITAQSLFELRAAALEIFDGAETPQVVRDAIEWYHGAIVELAAQQPAPQAEPIMHIYAEGHQRTVVEWKDGAKDLPDGDHLLYLGPPQAEAPKGADAIALQKLNEALGHDHPDLAAAALNAAVRIARLSATPAQAGAKGSGTRDEDIPDSPRDLVTQVQTDEGNATPPEAAISEDDLEAAYWNFDARKKGYGAFKGRAQSERDAFKWSLRGVPASTKPVAPATSADGATEPGKLGDWAKVRCRKCGEQTTIEFNIARLAAPTAPAGALAEVTDEQVFDAMPRQHQARTSLENIADVRAALSQGAAGVEGVQHHDDDAVDRFAVALKDKLAKQRAKGYGGWESCPPERLQEMLFKHIPKGDPVDVGNFAMFLWARGERTTYEDQWVFDLTGKWPGVPAGEPTDEQIDAIAATNLGDYEEGTWHRLFARAVLSLQHGEDRKLREDAAWGDHIPEQWRWNLHTFLDIAAGEGYELGGVDAAALFEAVFPDEYRAAIAAAKDGEPKP